LQGKSWIFLSYPVANIIGVKYVAGKKLDYPFLSCCKSHQVKDFASKKVGLSSLEVSM
jgi:hypothetical protein